MIQIALEDISRLPPKNKVHLGAKALACQYCQQRFHARLLISMSSKCDTYITSAMNHFDAPLDQ